MSEIIVKDNMLIQSNYTLDVAEQRIILLAIIEARKTNLEINQINTLKIHASAYAKNFDVNNESAYTILKEASKSLFERYVTYHDKNPKNGNDRSFHCRWVDKIGYEKKGGYIYLRFTQDVVPLITRLNEQSTTYELEQVSKLTSSYAIRIYELLIQWRSVGKTPEFELGSFRKQIGVTEEKYSRMSDFKKYVLDFSINQINTHTDITASYEQKKEGRKIVGFSFNFSQKNNGNEQELRRCGDTIDFINNMTEKQINTFANFLANDDIFNSKTFIAPVGLSMDDYVQRIKMKLRDSEKQKEWSEDLKRVGFKSNNFG